MRFLLFIFSIFACQILFAQVVSPGFNNQNNNLPKIIQNLDVEQDPMVVNLLNWHIQNNRIKNKIDGYRVEIFFSSDFDAKEKALKIKEEFLEAYPDFNVQNVHVKYMSPNFRVRVGDFRTKNEALKLHREIKNKYRVAFIVADAIDFPLKKQIEYERPN